MLWLTPEEMPGTSEPPVSELSDNAVLELADAKMNEAQNQRLGDLQSKGKAAGLTDAERYELLVLLQIYQLGQLRKSEALAEAIRRRLRDITHKAQAHGSLRNVS
jgi:PHD/YefM family antitoxin component YafN of YafNO toxin-antitoxin module